MSLICAITIMNCNATYSRAAWLAQIVTCQGKTSGVSLECTSRATHPLWVMSISIIEGIPQSLGRFQGCPRYSNLLSFQSWNDLNCRLERWVMACMQGQGCRQPGGYGQVDLIFWQTLICKLARVKDLGKYQTWNWGRLVSFEIVHPKKTPSFILILTCVI